MRQPSTWCGKATISAPGEKLLLLAAYSPLSESFPSIDLCRGVWFHLSRSSVCSVELEFKSMTLSHLSNALEHAATMLCSEKKSNKYSIKQFVQTCDTQCLCLVPIKFLMCFVLGTHALNCQGLAGESGNAVHWCLLGEVLIV